jgi:hypothetical protein
MEAAESNLGFCLLGKVQPLYTCGLMGNAWCFEKVPLQ